MAVSVIIPVYNAAPYVEQAVLSALEQPETGEVLLIEDGSPDGSLAVCQRLAQTHRKVRLLQHAGGGNRGAGATRNLGIQNSQCEFIAFLDADDYYLPNRFGPALKLLEEVPEADGVYEATQDFYDNPEILQKHEKAGTRKLRLNTLRQKVKPQDLFRMIHLEQVGHFWICSMTVRARVFEQTGLFDEHLREAQDKVLIRKMAAVCQLYPGRLDSPVAMRRVHARNRVTGVARPADKWLAVRQQDWETMLVWGQDRLSDEQKQILLLFFASALNRGLRMKRPITRFVPWAWLSVGSLLEIKKQYPELSDQGYYRHSLGRAVLLAVYPPKLLLGFWTAFKHYLVQRRANPSLLNES